MPGPARRVPPIQSLSGAASLSAVIAWRCATTFWGPEPFQDSLRGYFAAIEEVAPGLPVAGPGAYDAPW